MKEKFNLTEKERLSYILQLSILEKLDPKNDTYMNLREALESGYTERYKDLFDTFLYSELSEENCRLVRDILEMHRGLIWSAQNHGWEDMSEVEFHGFDCNDELEAKMASYAKYFMENLDRYDEIKRFLQGEYNSHMEMLPKYQRMLEVWKELPEHDKLRMTKEEMRGVLDA